MLTILKIVLRHQSSSLEENQHNVFNAENMDTLRNSAAASLNKQELNLTR